jgi:tetratricopeptide (TPR) repeat protein
VRRGSSTISSSTSAGSAPSTGSSTIESWPCSSPTTTWKPRQALELAWRELDVRRDVYTHDVLAWALYRNGRLQEALAEMTEALRLGTRDARLFFHAGLIHHALGHAEQAREYLEQALATNPHFHVLQADVARDVLVALD